MAVLLKKKLSSAGDGKTKANEAAQNHTASIKARGSLDATNMSDTSLGDYSGKVGEEAASHPKGTHQRRRSFGQTLTSSISRKLSGRRDPKTEYSGPPQYYQPAERPVNEESQKMDNQLDALLNTPDPSPASDEDSELADLLAHMAAVDERQQARMAQDDEYMVVADDPQLETPSFVKTPSECTYDQLATSIEHELQGVDSALSDTAFAAPLAAADSMEPHVKALVNPASNSSLEAKFAEINDLVLDLQSFL